MKLNKALVAVLFLTIFFAGTVAVEAGRFGRHHGAPGALGPGLHGLRTIIQLDLSDSQKLQLMNIMEKYDNERETLKESLREANKNLAGILESEQPDEAEIRNALRRAAPIKEELLVMRVKMMAELKTVLTPSQLQLLEKRRVHRFGREKARIAPVSEGASNQE